MPVPAVATTLAAAASELAPLLRGRDRPGTVVASTRQLIAARVDGDDPGLVCLTTRTAVRLPCAMVMPGELPDVDVGAPVSVGGGRLALPGVDVTAGRWWRASAPVVPYPGRCARHAAQHPPPPVDADLMDRARRLARALRDDSTDGTVATAVDELLGLGPGLTPAGDDVLAGVLVTLYAIEHAPGRGPVPAPRRHAAGMADRVASAVAACRPRDRTTAVSAGLLAYAARGRCVPELRDLLVRLGEPAGLARAPLRRLLGVGHTSGAALYAGVLCALDVLPPARSGATHHPSHCQLFQAR